jgi:hypothetical protein
MVLSRPLRSTDAAHNPLFSPPSGRFPTSIGPTGGKRRQRTGSVRASHVHHRSVADQLMPIANATSLRPQAVGENRWTETDAYFDGIISSRACCIGQRLADPGGRGRFRIGWNDVSWSATAAHPHHIETKRSSEGRYGHRRMIMEMPETEVIAKRPVWNAGRTGLTSVRAAQNRRVSGPGRQTGRCLQGSCSCCRLSRSPKPNRDAICAISVRRARSRRNNQRLHATRYAMTF